MLLYLLAAALGFYVGCVLITFTAVYNAQMLLSEQVGAALPKKSAVRYALQFAHMGPRFLYSEVRRSVGMALIEMILNKSPIEMIAKQHGIDLHAPPLVPVKGSPQRRRRALGRARTRRRRRSRDPHGSGRDRTYDGNDHCSTTHSPFLGTALCSRTTSSW